MTDSFRSALDAFTGILGVAAAITLLLAFLIAFNATSIATDERAREHATMFAFGLPRRSVVAMGMGENAVIGLLGTVVGVAMGFLLTRYTDAGQRLARHRRRRARRRGGGGGADPAVHGAPARSHGHPGHPAGGGVAGGTRAAPAS